MAETRSIDEQMKILSLGVVDLVSESELSKRLGEGRPLRIKLGIDPTAPDIHLGFAVVLRKLRQFQDLGHLAVLILGDFTAQVGDPSGRSATRPRLTENEVDAHAITYLAQVSAILDMSPERIEVRRNSEWLAPLRLADLVALASNVTVARMLERDDFSKRHASGSPISITEFLYPLLQAYDSVMVKADVELGGTDQLFNVLLGRSMQQSYDQRPQCVLTTPLLEGLDGVRKMSKSFGNTIGIAESPAEQFGKTMSIPDALLSSWATHTTGWSPDELGEFTNALESGNLAPVMAKRTLARRIVDLFHGEGSGGAAEAEFDRVFKGHGAPEEIPHVSISKHDLVDGSIRLARLLAIAGLVQSNAEGRRKISQGGVRIDDVKIEDSDLELNAAEIDGRILQVGRRAWAKLQLHQE